MDVEPIPAHIDQLTGRGVRPHIGGFRTRLVPRPHQHQPQEDRHDPAQPDEPPAPLTLAERHGPGSHAAGAGAGAGAGADAAVRPEGAGEELNPLAISHTPMNNSHRPPGIVWSRLRLNPRTSNTDPHRRIAYPTRPQTPTSRGTNCVL